MSDRGEPDITRLIRDLVRELQRLQRELEPNRRRRMPTGHELSRFTSEVAIPGIILILETNIRALQLLRRTIRLAEGRDPRGANETASPAVRRRAEELGQTALVRLDSTLAEVQSSLEEQSASDEAEQLLTEARELQAKIQQRLEPDGSDTTETGVDPTESDPVGIDVDAELESLKDNLEDDDGSDEADGSDDGDDGVDQ